MLVSFARSSARARRSRLLDLSVALSLFVVCSPAIGGLIHAVPYSPGKPAVAPPSTANYSSLVTQTAQSDLDYLNRHNAVTQYVLGQQVQQQTSPPPPSTTKPGGNENHDSRDHRNDPKYGYWKDGCWHWYPGCNPNQPVPEPSTFVLAGLAGAAIALTRLGRWR